MLIAKMTLDHPVLAEPLRQVPGIELTWEETYERRDGRTQMLVWIDSDDWAAVARAIETDPSINESEILADVHDRRLYRVGFTKRGQETNLMPMYIEVGAVLQSAVGTNEGWTVRARFPDRAGLEHIFNFCKENDITAQVDSVFEQRDWATTDSPNLTNPQREILVAAIENGYLSIPRECSLQDIGERLGITDSAASERFRRAVRNLIEHSEL